MNDFYNKLIMYHQIQTMKRDGWSVSKIASYLVINRRTVQKYLHMSEEEYFEYQASLKKRKKDLQDYEAFVKVKLEHFPDTSAAQIHDWLKEHYDNFPNVSARTVFNFVQWVRQEYNIPKIKKQRDYFIVEELPYGKQTQVDFGEYNMRNGQGKRVKVYFFSMVLSRSRFKYLYFSLSPFTTSHVIVAHQKAFEYIGGIPEEIVYDQDSVLMHDENKGDLILTEKFREYCNKMGFDLHFCRKADPESKGKIENVIKYIKQNFLYNRPFCDIETLNKEALAWLTRTGNGMPHNFTKQKPYDMWIEEKSHLKPFVSYSVAPDKNLYTVRVDNSILYKGNYYSLPEGTYKDQNTVVNISIQDDKLIIHDVKGQFIYSHTISSGKGEKIRNTDHKRDKSKSIDNLLIETAMKFPDYDLATKYLEEIRRIKNRYARDQLSAIYKAIEPVSPEIVIQTLKYCIDNAIYSAMDFIAVLEKNIGQGKQNKQTGFKAPNKIQSCLAKNIAELTPNTSNIIDYEQIMKN
ncbi:MAG: IS21 family transposase [Bacteroidales bacterium]